MKLTTETLSSCMPLLRLSGLASVLVAAATPLLAQDPNSKWIALTPGAAPGTPAEIIVNEAASGLERTAIEVRVHGYFLGSAPVPQGFPGASVRVPGLTSTDAPGLPSLPVATISLAVPTDAKSALVSVLPQQGVSEHQVGVAPAPLAELDEELENEAPGDGDPDGEPAEWFLNDQVYGSSGFYPASIAPKEALAVENALGAVPHVSFEVFVAGWNPATGELRVQPEVKLMVDHPGELPTHPPLSQAKSKIALQRFMNWELVKIQFPGHGLSFVGRYLFVYPEAMYAELKPLINQKKSRGFLVSLITIESTLGTCTDIRDAIHGWYDAGSTVDQFGDAYCLLVGDVDRIPLCSDPVDGKPTDDLYASPHGDDLEEEIWLGRLSIDDATDLDNQVSKILDYEDEAVVGAAWEEALLVAHKQDAPGKYEGAHEDVRTASYSNAPTFTTLYGSTGATDADVSAEIEAGLGLVCYRGHGSSNAWTNWSTSGDSYHKDDVIALDEPIQTPVVWSIACTNNKLDYVGSTTDADCIGETWLEEPQSGGVAHYGSTVASYTTANHELDRELFDAVYDEGITTHAQAIADAEDEMTAAYPTYGAKNAWRYLLLGDPQMTVRRGHSSIVIDPPGGFDPLPVPGFIDILVLDDEGNMIEDALVACWKPGPDDTDDVFVNRYTGPDGIARLPIAPASAGLLRVTALDQDGNEALTQIPIGCGPEAYGENLGGANVFSLESSGAVQPGGVASMTIDTTGYETAPGTPAFFVFGFGQSQLPILGGTLLVDPGKILKIQTTTIGQDGSAEAAISIPAVKGLEGKQLFAQALHLAPEQPQGFAFSNGVALSLCPIDG